MKWVLVVIAVLGGLVLLMALVGAALPRHHRASVRARLAQPADAVFGAVADFAAWPTWNPSVKSMKRLPDRDGRPVWLMVDRNGRLPSEVLESVAPAPSRPGHLITRIADPTLPFGGTWTWEVSPRDQGCDVTITEDGEIHNWIFRFMARFVFGYAGTATSFVRALGRKFGETVSAVEES